MKVILRQNYEPLGKMGARLEVKDGYARNYLIPRGLAYPATSQYEKMLLTETRLHDKRVAHLQKAAADQAERLSGITVTTYRKAGEEGRLFGSVTSTDIAELLAEQGIEVDRRKITLDEPIKVLGNYQVRIHLHEQVNAMVGVAVLKEE
ncbi:MAG: 50S ribosomal protein L9 [Candidatus Zixiibacteriota bacterium]|nr:MAG: 50S ribosomal protein L9 [candidate division Zixibacteria bacterium]